MMTDVNHSDWQGMFVAAVTPLTADGEPDVQALPGLLDFYARRGCHGVLLFGTTGEGPAFTVTERCRMLDVAAAWRASQPDFRVLVGVGTPTLGDTITLIQATFESGLDGVVCLPPYYFRDATPAGLSDYFGAVIEAAVPESGGFFFYHIPKISGIGVPHATIAALLARYPAQISGLKDSSGDLVHLQALRRQFPQLRVFVGNDAIIAPALQLGAAGAITALSNVYSPQLRALYDLHHAGQDTAALQARTTAARQALTAGPVIAGLKHVLRARHDFPHWPLRPPLAALAADADLPLLTHLDNDV